jgi:uncharacterized protein (DUF1778 family)
MRTRPQAKSNSAELESIAIRISPALKKLIRLAARRQGLPISAFAREATIRAARVIMDKGGTA